LPSYNLHAVRLICYSLSINNHRSKTDFSLPSAVETW